MTRITDKQLQGMINRLNRLTNSPMEYMTDGQINIGHYHIDRAYSGCQLVRTMNSGGGVTTPIGGGFCTKREMYDKLYAFIRGIETAKGE